MNLPVGFFARDPKGQEILHVLFPEDANLPGRCDRRFGVVKGSRQLRVEFYAGPGATRAQVRSLGFVEFVLPESLPRGRGLVLSVEHQGDALIARVEGNSITEERRLPMTP